MPVDSRLMARLSLEIDRYTTDARCGSLGYSFRFPSRADSFYNSVLKHCGGRVDSKSPRAWKHQPEEVQTLFKERLRMCKDLGKYRAENVTHHGQATTAPGSSTAQFLFYDPSAASNPSLDNSRRPFDLSASSPRDLHLVQRTRKSSSKLGEGVRVGRRATSFSPVPEEEAAVRFAKSGSHDASLYNRGSPCSASRTRTVHAPLPDQSIWPSTETRDGQYSGNTLATTPGCQDSCVSPSFQQGLSAGGSRGSGEAPAISGVGTLNQRQSISHAHPADFLTPFSSNPPTASGQDVLFDDFDVFYDAPEELDELLDTTTFNKALGGADAVELGPGTSDVPRALGLSDVAPESGLAYDVQPAHVEYPHPQYGQRVPQGCFGPAPMRPSLHVHPLEEVPQQAHDLPMAADRGHHGHIHQYLEGVKEWTTPAYLSNAEGLDLTQSIHPSTTTVLADPSEYPTYQCGPETELYSAQTPGVHAQSSAVPWSSSNEMEMPGSEGWNASVPHVQQSFHVDPNSDRGAFLSGHTPPSYGQDHNAFLMHQYPASSTLSAPDYMFGVGTGLSADVLRSTEAASSRPQAWPIDPSHGLPNSSQTNLHAQAPLSFSSALPSSISAPVHSWSNHPSEHFAVQHGGSSGQLDGREGTRYAPYNMRERLRPATASPNTWPIATASRSNVASHVSQAGPSIPHFPVPFPENGLPASDPSMDYSASTTMGYSWNCHDAGGFHPPHDDAHGPS